MLVDFTRVLRFLSLCFDLLQACKKVTSDLVWLVVHMRVELLPLTQDKLLVHLRHAKELPVT